MAEPKPELARTSEQTLGIAGEIEDLESRKRDTQIGSEEFHDMARTVTQKTRDLAGSVERQEHLGNAAQQGPESIEDVEESVV